MARNETDRDPTARKQDSCGADSGRGERAGSGGRNGSNKVVVALWVTLLLGGSSWYAYSRQKDQAEAERLLNEAYTLYGQGDLTASTESLRQSAELGSTWAQLYYGERLRNGFGAERNPAEAVKWLRKAAKKNCAEAYFQLGACYENGDGVERNPDEAEAWYGKAQNAGYGGADRALERLANQKRTGGSGSD